MPQKRDTWLDYMKVFACILVTLGHFVQSMTKSGFLPGGGWVQWFNTTIYTFHVPLFFICSGYLYQKYSRVRDFSGWKNHVLKKALALGVPYFVFSLITWLMKAIFAEAVNTENAGLLETLFLNPMPPYWYLYVLFFLFAIVPTFRNQKTLLIVFGGAAVCRLILCWTGELPVYLVYKCMEFAVWFLAGMALVAFKPLEKSLACRKQLLGVGLAVLFLGLSLVTWKMPEQSLLRFGMGILGCTATVLVMKGAFSGDKVHPIWAWMARYTMPVFLMHTIFSAGWRSVLLKVGISNASVHMVTGLIISFAGPILAAWIMGKIRGLDFIMYPGKYLRVGGKTPDAKR